MKRLPGIGLLVSLLVPAWAKAQSAFDGTWKFELSTAQFPKKPDVFLLQDGKYSCKSVFPQLKSEPMDRTKKSPDIRTLIR